MRRTSNEERDNFSKALKSLTAEEAISYLSRLVFGFMENFKRVLLELATPRASCFVSQKIIQSCLAFSAVT